MKKPRRIGSLLLVAPMVLTRLPLGSLSVFAATGEELEHGVLPCKDRTCEMTDNISSAIKLQISSKIDNYTVASVEYYANSGFY